MIWLHQVPERHEGAGRVQNVEFRVWFEEFGIVAAVGLAADEEYGAAEPHQGRFVQTWNLWGRVAKGVQLIRIYE